MLQISLRRMQKPGLRRICVVRRHRSCNQSLHDTNVYDGCVGALLPRCTSAQYEVSNWVNNASGARTKIMLQGEELLPGRMHSLLRQV